MKNSIMLKEITHKSFESIVSETVELRAGELGFRADVESVDLLQTGSGPEQQSFSVVLQAHDLDNHGQQMYQLSHPGLGDLDLFMVPIGPGESGMRYEIIFN